MIHVPGSCSRKKLKATLENNRELDEEEGRRRGQRICFISWRRLIVAAQWGAARPAVPWPQYTRVGRETARQRTAFNEEETSSATARKGHRYRIVPGTPTLLHLLYRIRLETGYTLPRHGVREAWSQTGFSQNYSKNMQLR